LSFDFGKFGMKRLRPTWTSLAVFAWYAGTQALAQDAEVTPVITIVGTLPIPSIAQPLSEIPSAVQTANSKDLADSQALDLSSFMSQRLGGVYVNEVQGNPHQMDVNYRGFTASPLLGTPQGLSVYMDGVRMNQPFGDVVSWDLIPRSAIHNLTLMPGSNPLFGLNTLGGALAVQTKSGLNSLGTSVQTTIGSHQRRSAEFEHGGRNDKGLHWFVTGNVFNEEGWRDASPSRVRQVFGKLGWKDGATDMALTLSHANNALTGNGMQEERMLANDYRSVYTKPDQTYNRSTLLNLAGKHDIDDNTLFAGNAYYRTIRTSTLNGDVNEGSLDQSVYQLSAADRKALQSAGYKGYPTAVSGLNKTNTPFPMWRCIAQALQNDEPGEKCTGLLNRTQTDQSNFGFAGQLTLLDQWFGHRNQFTGGMGYDTNRTEFVQTSQLGYVNPDRSITGINAFADGATGGNVDGVPFDNRVNLKGSTSTWSVFASDTISIHDRWHLTLSGRYNRTHVINQDQITPGGGAGSLDGNYVYQRLNPAVGLAFAINPVLGTYMGYSESSRTPTSIELGCADPANPCKLPNAMAGDPPLKQVVTKSWEAGLRGVLSANTQWSAGVFRAQSNDDILFVAAPNASSFGYFKNFGQTLRQGVELGLNSKQGRLKYGAHYTWLQATYQSAETLGGSANSSSDASSPGLDGRIDIKPGDALPLTPKQILKLHADYQWNEAWRTGLGMTAFGSMFARGNENNQHQANGLNYLGSGKTAGYNVINFNASYKSSQETTWLFNIMNLLNRQFATGAQLGPTAFNSNGTQLVARPYAGVGSPAQYPLQNSMFVAPGAPRSIWLSMRHTFN
jgi:outer membrane receptor protein involved in Fe transport